MEASHSIRKTDLALAGGKDSFSFPYFVVALSPQKGCKEEIRNLGVKPFPS
jgi:hypothetical protein